MMAFSSLGLEKRFPPGSSPAASIGSPLLVPVTPAPDGIEILQAKPDRVEHLMAIRADGIRAVQLGALAQGQVRDRRLVLFFQGRNVRRGRRHMFPEHLFQHPHAAFDGTGAVGEGGRRENARHSQDPPRLPSLSRTFRISGPVTVSSRP